VEAVDSLNSSNSSWQAEVLHNALCNFDNLSCGSDEPAQESCSQTEEQDTHTEASENSMTRHSSHQLANSTSELSF
jgi:hypothetical protein